MRFPSGPVTQTPGSCCMRSLLTKTTRKYSPGVWPTGCPVRSSSILCFCPVLADADVHCERRVEVVRAHHLRPDELLDVLCLRVRHLEQELVVHLQDEAGAAALLAQPAVDADHCDLDDVGVRALHREVNGDALAARADLRIGDAQL